MAQKVQQNSNCEAQTLMGTSYENYIKNHQYGLALSEVEILLKNDSYNIGLLEVRAKILLKLERYPESIDYYNSLINLIPGSADHYAGRGLCFHHLNQKSEALENFSKAVELEPKNGYRYSSRAFIRGHQGDSQGAIEDYNIAISLDPEDAISLNNKGIIEEKLGRMELAQESYVKADKLEGVDVQPIVPPQVEVKEKSRPVRKMSFRYALATIRNILSSKKERKAFLSFIFKR